MANQLAPFTELQTILLRALKHALRDSHSRRLLRIADEHPAKQLRLTIVFATRRDECQTKLAQSDPEFQDLRDLIRELMGHNTEYISFAAALLLELRKTWPLFVWDLIVETVPKPEETESKALIVQPWGRLVAKKFSDFDDRKFLRSLRIIQDQDPSTTTS